MKKQRTSTVFLLLAVLSVSAVLRGRADTWVTVNPDGSVTRTTVTTGSSPATNGRGNHAPARAMPVSPSQSRSNVSSYASAYPYPPTGYYYPGQYPLPSYPPYYPPAPVTNYNYYYPPAPSYNGPLYPTPYGTPPWITSIPLGTTYYPPAYAQPCQPCAVCGHYPCVCHNRGIYGSFSIGGGGLNITIGGGSYRTSTTTTTTIGR